MSASFLVYCRFCAEQKPSADITYLKTQLDFRNEIVEKLSFFNITWIDFSIENLPQTICSMCYHSFNVSYEFFTKIKISQAVLTNLITSSLKHEASDEGASTHSHEGASSNIKEELSTVDSEISDLLDKCENNMFVDFISAENQNHSALTTPVPEDIKADASWKVYPWICAQCNAKFDNVKLLRDHSKETHGICNCFHCSNCDTNIDAFNEFVDHVRGHIESLRHYCPHCNMKLEDTTHSSIHTSQPNCSACGEQFTNKSTLQRHLKRYQPSKKRKKSKDKISIKELLSYGVELLDSKVNIESWYDYPWICQYCKTKVSDLYLLRTHLKDVHSKCFGMKCVDCQDSIYSFGAFVDHVREHRSSLKFYCQYCNCRLSTPDQNIIHIKENHSVPQCDSCGELFKETAELEVHKAVYDPPKRKKTPRKHGPFTVHDLTCRVCHKVAKCINNLRAHEKLHTDRRRDFFCDRCGKSFYTKGALTAHHLIHENLEPQICKICKKSFLTITRLKKHINSHYGEKPFQCAECQKCFRLKEQLKGHMITHSDTLPYGCQYCDKRFRFKNVLKNHESTHTGARPYICDVCRMDFSCWSNCDKHMKRKHGVTMAKTKLTPRGKVPITKNCRLKKIKDIDGDIKEWTEKIMVPRKRGKKS